MALGRIILVILIGLSLTVAPAFASMSASTDAHVAVSMEDCEGMAEDHCPCCEEPVECSSGACLAKCFKVFGEPQRQLLRLAVYLPREGADPLRPPEIAAKPPAPPPRT